MPENEGADRTMFVKSQSIDQNQGKYAKVKISGVPKLNKMDGGSRTKIKGKSTEPMRSGVPVPIYTDDGLRPAKPDDSKA